MLAMGLVSLNTVQSQPLTDTLFYWQDYGRPSFCRIQIFPAPADDDQTHAIVIQELVENQGAVAVMDAQLLVELIGRNYEIAPEEAYWIFHWGWFSFADAMTSKRKELFLRATFRRSSRRALGTPSWRIATREEVEYYTDRLFR